MIAPDQTTAILLKNQLPLTAFFANVTRGYHLAEDVFQEVCVAAVRHDGGFESEDHVINWARLLGRNRSIDVVRARDGRYEGLSDDVLEQLATAIQENAGQEGGRLQEALRECMSLLTANNLEILRLRYFEGLTSGTVAALLNRKIETVYQAIARIHKFLGECIEERLAESEAAS